MICAGSGIAPFRSFWMQRQYELENGRGPLGKMFLFFGCRQSKLDNIYGNDLPQLLNQGVLHDIFYAYSRDQQHKKVKLKHYNYFEELFSYYDEL